MLLVMVFCINSKVAILLKKFGLYKVALTHNPVHSSGLIQGQNYLFIFFDNWLSQLLSDSMWVIL